MKISRQYNRESADTILSQFSVDCGLSSAGYSKLGSLFFCGFVYELKLMNIFGICHGLWIIINMFPQIAIFYLRLPVGRPCERPVCGRKGMDCSRFANSLRRGAK